MSTVLILAGYSALSRIAFAPSDTGGVSSPGATSAPSPIDKDITIAEELGSTVADALGQPEIGAGLAVAGTLATTAADDVAAHKSAVVTALDVSTKAIATAPAVIATLPADVAAKATSGLQAANSFLSWWNAELAKIEAAI